MSGEQLDPIHVAAQLGGASEPTLDEVAGSQVFAEPEPASPITPGEADEAELLLEGERGEEVPGPDADGEPVADSP